MSEDQKVQEFELSEATKRHIESVIAQEMTQVVAVMSATIQRQLAEAGESALRKMYPERYSC